MYVNDIDRNAKRDGGNARAMCVCVCAALVTGARAFWTCVFTNRSSHHCAVSMCVPVLRRKSARRGGDDDDDAVQEFCWRIMRAQCARASTRPLCVRSTRVCTTHRIDVIIQNYRVVTNRMGLKTLSADDCGA